jgi:hypothetical protein
MTGKLKLTRKGLRSLKAPDGLEPGLVLLVEVMRHVEGEGIDEENLCTLLDELVASEGSIENAIVALKTSKRKIGRRRDDPPEAA